MKTFKEWDKDEKTSFVMFLAKETQRQKRKLRTLHKHFNIQSEIDCVHSLHVQQGIAAEANTIYSIAKDHFGFSNRKIVEKCF